jgi:hypothetical protein
MPSPSGHPGKKAKAAAIAVPAIGRHPAVVLASHHSNLLI